MSQNTAESTCAISESYNFFALLLDPCLTTFEMVFYLWDGLFSQGFTFEGKLLRTGRKQAASKEAWKTHGDTTCLRLSIGIPRAFGHFLFNNISSSVCHYKSISVLFWMMYRILYICVCVCIYIYILLIVLILKCKKCY